MHYSLNGGNKTAIKASLTVLKGVYRPFNFFLQIINSNKNIFIKKTNLHDRNKYLCIWEKLFHKIYF